MINCEFNTYSYNIFHVEPISRAEEVPTSGNVDKKEVELPGGAKDESVGDDDWVSDGSWETEEENTTNTVSLVNTICIIFSFCWAGTRTYQLILLPLLL